MSELRLLSLCGCLGYGYQPVSLERGLAAGPDLIGCDNGSTDAGPYYLGSGEQLTPSENVRRDLEPALVAAVRTGTPLVVGSAGTSGRDVGVDRLVGIVEGIAARHGLSFRLGVIRSEIPRSTLAAAIDAGRVASMPGVPPLDARALEHTGPLVAQLGVEPFAAALDAGADVIVAGRACDTSIFAALAALRGADMGLAMHLAKILECGAQFAEPLAANDSAFGVLGADAFEVSPLHPDRRCTTEGVAAHSMYEQSDPFVIHEPGGHLDLHDAEYTQVDDRTVRVSGSRWVSAPHYRVKVEGTVLRGHRSLAIGGVRDPYVIDALPEIEYTVRDTVAATFPDATTRFVVYGRNGVLHDVEPHRGRPHEVAVLLDVVAPEADQARAALALARSGLMHCPFPGRKTTAGNVAFPFSPADLEGGPVYEFSVYHLLELDEPPERAFPVELADVC